MPRGGSRVGSGRKPKPGKTPAMVPFVSLQGGKVAQGASNGSEVSLIAPEDLPLVGREFWHQYAGLAIESATLTPRTIPGFRWLCETYAEMRANEATIQTDGRTYIKCTVDGAGNEHQELKAHPLTTTLNKLRKDVDQGMARFCLTAFGKPAAGAVKKAASVNPWQQVVSR
jgi:hypothetical protein